MCKLREPAWDTVQDRAKLMELSLVTHVQGQLAVHGLAVLPGRIEAGISNRGKFFLHHVVR